MSIVWLDEYERRARLVPGLITLLPFAIAGVGLGFRQLPVVSALFSLITAVGGPVLLANLVRTRGRALQSALFSEWAGEPTLQYLRAGDSSDVQRHQRRARIENVLKTSLPTREEESRDLAAADSGYRAAVDQLRELTRDRQRFPLIFAENRNYGFERNLLAMKPPGLVVVGCAGLAVLIGIALQIGDLWHASLRDLAITLLAIAAVFIFWLVYPTKERVRAAGEIYAERLLDATVML